jgi:hypothetical protein
MKMMEAVCRASLAAGTVAHYPALALLDTALGAVRLMEVATMEVMTSTLLGCCCARASQQRRGGRRLAWMAWMAQ